MFDQVSRANSSFHMSVERTKVGIIDRDGAYSHQKIKQTDHS